MTTNRNPTPPGGPAEDRSGVYDCAEDETGLVLYQDELGGPWRVTFSGEDTDEAREGADRLRQEYVRAIVASATAELRAEREQDRAEYSRLNEQYEEKSEYAAGLERECDGLRAELERTREQRDHELARLAAISTYLDGHATYGQAAEHYFSAALEQVAAALASARAEERELTGDLTSRDRSQAAPAAPNGEE